MTGKRHPPEFSLFFFLVVAMSVSGFLGVLLLAVPATRTYRRLRAAYALDPSLDGEWIIRWGWPIIVGCALLVTLLVVVLLF